ncbi:biotin-dependent carboxyltransferase family protein [Albimonas sp. CAU 1670]|uniref:5-oxoprolinase subunit C family protein n=1 Tax=Albimonas sp. CAU 1670 TaxID=3032599 RepID=UPI0023DB84F4|nr:biotin-dependent carboxyltransferase family protein [Albimonas sp. CAU 1670]MDF2230951.1 biotin-dependent carboxyltransferase family protein [Albimonas sp. CAU 1670]
MPFKVLKPGLLTTVQDLGRPGYFHLGIPQGGAMDRLSLRAANLLVGNPEDAAALEAVFLGPELEFQSDGLVAVTGADLPILLDGEEQPGWTAFPVKAGQVLSFGYLKSGARIIIAVSGGIATEAALGSRSTYAIGALGGVNGRAVAAGDVIPTGEPGAGKAGASVPADLRRGPGSPAELRVLPGLFWHWITPAAQKAFFEDEWKVAPEADRMGYRFKGGRPMEFEPRERPFGAGSDPSNIVDGCYPYGSVQVPGGTEPIVLHRDAVSGGGYFMVGTVISADMDLIGQLQPHMPVKFVEATMDSALAARAERKAVVARIREALA